MDCNKYFVWEDGIDGTFERLSWIDICEMKKQKTFSKAIKSLI